MAISTGKAAVGSAMRYIGLSFTAVIIMKNNVKSPIMVAGVVWVFHTDVNAGESASLSEM